MRPRLFDSLHPPQPHANLLFLCRRGLKLRQILYFKIANCCYFKKQLASQNKTKVTTDANCSG